MNESELRQLWLREEPVYKAWGYYVLEEVSAALSVRGRDLESFFKVQVKPRLKSDKSLIDKAFYRPEKSYSDPYAQIEDKVGIRFVVLLLDDISEICEVIEGSECWSFDGCKHFEQDRINSPLLFSYQSVHYILRPNEDVEFNGEKIPAGTPCEVQIRTLLQHAHAELTHDAIYKAKKEVHPEVHRTVAKSMALIETTDDFFSQATRRLSYGPLKEYGVVEGLDLLYFQFSGLKSTSQRSASIIFDEFECFIDGSLLGEVSELIMQRPFLADKLKERYFSDLFFTQSVVLFVYWMLVNKKRRLLHDWPLSRAPLELMATDLGVSIYEQ